MKIGLKFISIALLLLIGTESAFAGPWSRGGGGRGEARAERQARGQQEARPQMQVDPRRVQVVPAPAFPGGYGEPGRPGYIIRPADQPRVFGPRMSVEERQAMRQRIHEAGQHIYTPGK